MDSLLLFIGCLNREAPYFQGARGKGLSVYAFDETSLAVSKRAETTEVENPTYLSVTPDGRYVYANSEVFGWNEGVVTAFGYDPASQALRYINTQPTLGSIAAQNTLTRDGRHLLLVNYGISDAGPNQSLVVFGLRPDGGLTPPLASVAHSGSGPNAARQERPHAHSVTETIAGGMAIVADLGIDQLVTYTVGPNGALTRLAACALRPGAGPRHLALSSDGRFVFVINELDSTVVSLSFDGVAGTLTEVESHPAVPANLTVDNHCADIQISPDGRFLYCSNRGHDSIAILSVDPANGRLSTVGHVPCGGATPRNLALTPSGRFLLSANQNADQVRIFARDAETGGLQDTGKGIDIGTPMCLKFAQVSASLQG
jgi:6-phosphogluconolactonase